MKFKEFVKISESLQYHVTNDIPLHENIYRVGSKKYYELFSEARRLMKEGSLEIDDFDKWMLENTDIGEHALYEGQHVPLDCPLIEEKEPELNSPKRNSGPGKKYVVYVRNPKTGNVKRIEFGDEKGGLSSKINDKDAAKSFAARHNCDTKNDKMSPGYWSCRLPWYAKQLGLSGGGKYFW